MSETAETMFEVVKLLRQNLSVINSINMAFRREPMDTRRLEAAQHAAEHCLVAISDYFFQEVSKEKEATPRSQENTLEISNHLEQPSKVPEDGMMG